MKNSTVTALHKSLKLTRNLINISFLIIFAVLLLWGKHNPAAAFAIIFYNALFWLLLSSQKSKEKEKNSKNTVLSAELAEINTLKLTLTAGIFLHLLLGYGFMYKIHISIAELKILPLVLAVIIIIFRYLSYFYIKRKLHKKEQTGR